MGHPLDLTQWKRREHYHLFRGMPNPWFSICLEVNVTRLWERSRDGELSFFLAALYLAMRAANQTEAFRLRLRDAGVWVHDRVDASSTIMREDETFVFTQFPTLDRFADFQTAGHRVIEQARAEVTLGGQPVRDDLIYHSTVPWIRFTAFTNPFSTNDDSIPRIVFGKVFDGDGHWRMPLAIEVHHALVDGLDVARFVERFQAGLDAPLE
jgi:chloramphenicol O-acetyltransferase type A